LSRIISPDNFIDQITGIISPKKQVNHPFIDLTVHKIYRMRSSGRVDFGGSEFEGCVTEPCLPVKQNAEDSYGWWDLHEGYFEIEYNESFTLSKNQIAIIQPHIRLLKCGCLHPTLFITQIDNTFQMQIWVPKIGIKIKENSRVSQLFIYEL
jgi:deoxycytidine triphosphate deaminase